MKKGARLPRKKRYKMNAEVVYNRSRSMKGYLTGGHRRCQEEGCGGDAYPVLWDNGKRGILCAKGLWWDKEVEAYRVGSQEEWDAKGGTLTPEEEGDARESEPVIANTDNSAEEAQMGYDPQEVVFKVVQYRRAYDDDDTVAMGVEERGVNKIFIHSLEQVHDLHALIDDDGTIAGYYPLVPNIDGKVEVDLDMPIEVFHISETIIPTKEIFTTPDGLAYQVRIEPFHGLIPREDAP